MVNGVPGEVPIPRDFPRDSIHHDTPKAFHIFSFFCHPGPVNRDFFHCRQNLPAPRQYHTQYCVVKVHRFLELNPNILVRLVERMDKIKDFNFYIL